MRDAFDNLCEQADKIIQNHKTMEQIKIQNITPQGTFDYNGKTFHKFDSSSKTAWSEKSTLSPLTSGKSETRCKVKDHNTTKWGPRLKLDKPGFNGGGSPSPKAMTKQRRQRHRGKLGRWLCHASGRRPVPKGLRLHRASTCTGGLECSQSHQRRSRGLNVADRKTK